MKRRLMLFLVVAFMTASLGLAGCSGSEKQSVATKPAKEETTVELLARGSNLPGFSSDIIITSTEGIMSGKIWVGGKSMRSEMVVHNQKLITILDSEANAAYMYNMEQNAAVKMPFDKAKSASPNLYAYDVDAAKVTMLETTVYEGVKCKVLSVREDKEQSKLWVREDYGIPLRVETKDETGDTMVIEYKNMKIGSQPADIFTLPTGVQISDVGDMMKQE